MRQGLILPNSGYALIGGEQGLRIPGLPATLGYDVILLAGQSNMVGYGAPLSYPTDAGGARLFQFAQNGPSINTIVPANEPLLHPDATGVDNNYIGHAVACAKLYANAIISSRAVLLVPCAVGGTAFSGNRWNPGDDLFEAAVVAANAAVASGSGNQFVGVLWHQGEWDVSLSAGDYAFRLDRAVAAFRARITGATNSWFVLGQMVPETIAADASLFQIDRAHQNTPLRLLKAAMWQGATGTSDGGNHYNAARQRLNGAAAYAALSFLSSSTVVPGQVAGLTVGAISDTSVTLAWSSPNVGAIATDYLIEYRQTGVSLWQTFAHPRQPATSMFVTGLGAGTPYDFRVSAISTPGTGVPSAVTSGTTSGVAAAGAQIVSRDGSSITTRNGAFAIARGVAATPTNIVARSGILVVTRDGSFLIGRLATAPPPGGVRSDIIARNGASTVTRDGSSVNGRI